jgi:hypothetical protein
MNMQMAMNAFFDAYVTVLLANKRGSASAEQRWALLRARDNAKSALDRRSFDTVIDMAHRAAN